jgi:hypothetical protein
MIPIATRNYATPALLSERGGQQLRLPAMLTRMESLKSVYVDAEKGT